MGNHPACLHRFKKIDADTDQGQTCRQPKHPWATQAMSAKQPRVAPTCCPLLAGFMAASSWPSRRPSRIVNSCCSTSRLSRLPGKGETGELGVNKL